MLPKPKNIIIFVAIGLALVCVYIFFIRKPSDESNTTVVSGEVTSSGTPIATDGTEAVTDEFLALLLNIKNIKLNDSIFSDAAFTSLKDSSIILTPDGTEGRPNPFAPLGVDNPSPSSNPSTFINYLDPNTQASLNNPTPSN